MFTLIGNTDVLYEFSVEKLVHLRFPGSLGEIESGKKKAEIFSYIYFFCMCSVVPGLALPIVKS